MSDHSNQVEPQPESSESQDKQIKQVESGMAPAWLKWKPAPTTALHEKDRTPVC